jgi:hypothetical protein
LDLNTSVGRRISRSGSSYYHRLQVSLVGKDVFRGNTLLILYCVDSEAGPEIIAMMPYYFVCETCTAKWFTGRELMACPRCGALAASTEKIPIPWGSRTMRITRRNYEKARAAVEIAREQLKLVKIWEDTLRRMGDLGNQQLTAITVNGDGSVRTECELVHGRGDSSASEGKPE